MEEWVGGSSPHVAVTQVIFFRQNWELPLFSHYSEMDGFRCSVCNRVNSFPFPFYPIDVAVVRVANSGLIKLISIFPIIMSRTHLNLIY